MIYDLGISRRGKWKRLLGVALVLSLAFTLSTIFPRPTLADVVFASMPTSADFLHAEKRGGISDGGPEFAGAQAMADVPTLVARGQSPAGAMAEVKNAVVMRDMATCMAYASRKPSVVSDSGMSSLPAMGGTVDGFGEVVPIFPIRNAEIGWAFPDIGDVYATCEPQPPLVDAPLLSRSHKTSSHIGDGFGFLAAFLAFAASASSSPLPAWQWGPECGRLVKAFGCRSP